MSNFFMGRRSRGELVGVHSDLVVVVTTALVLSDIDFAVHDGLRTEDEQRALLDAGDTWTMDSDHLRGLAVDLVPYVDGVLTWEMDALQQVGKAMRAASERHRIPVIWGALERYGGDWKTQNDAAHWALPRDLYAQGRIA